MKSDLQRPKERILVCGGAIATFLAVKLHANEHKVDLIGRRKIEHLRGTHAIRIQETTYDLPPILDTFPTDASYDLVVLATKLHHLPDILTIINNVRLSARMIVSIQNGLVDTSQFSELLGNQRLLVASVFDGFRIDGDRLLTTNTGRGWKVEDSPEGRHVAWLFSDAAIPCVSEPNLDRARTEKSIVNCCLNALSAIYNKTFVQLFSDPVLSKRIERLFHECYDVLSTEHPLDDREVLKKRLFDDWRYAEHYSSTWQDVTEEKETEIDFLNGYIIRLGRKYGLSTLENEKIIEELQAISSLHLHS